MSEEAIHEVEGIEEPTLENEVTTEAGGPEYTEIEIEAMEQGWNPEGVEGKRSLTAEEFLDRKPLYDKMHKLEKRLKEQDKKFEAMQQHEKMVRERMHKEHLTELKAAKKDAFERLDYDAVEKIDDEIYQAKKEYDNSADIVEAKAKSTEAAVNEWAEKNPWYLEDKILSRYAYGEGQDFKRENPDAEIDEVLAHIEKAVKKEFPEKFQNMNRQKPSSVEGSATGSRRVPAAPKQKTAKDLPEEAISVMKTLVRAGAFKSEQDYVNDYFNQK